MLKKMRGELQKAYDATWCPSLKKVTLFVSGNADKIESFFKVHWQYQFPELFTTTTHSDGNQYFVVLRRQFHCADNWCAMQVTADFSLININPFRYPDSFRSQ